MHVFGIQRVTTLGKIPTMNSDILFRINDSTLCKMKVFLFFKYLNHLFENVLNFRMQRNKEIRKGSNIDDKQQHCCNECQRIQSY